MDLNRLTRDADDLIRKVVSRYNHLYIPTGSISQLELDLMLDDLRSLYDTFKTIGHVNLSLQQNQQKPEVTVHTHAPAGIQRQETAPGMENFNPSETQKNILPETQPSSETKIAEASQPETELAAELETEPPATYPSEPESLPHSTKETEAETKPEEFAQLEAKAFSPYDRKSIPGSEKAENQEVVQSVDEKPASEGIQGNAPSMLADRFISGNKSLSDTIGSAPEKDVVGGRMLFQPIADLTTGIGLNDKFNFVSELFGNNQVHYDEAISRINKAVNMDEANWIFQKYHTPEWEHKQEAIKRMKDFIKRRFI